MKYLHKGSQSQEQLDALLSFGKSTSEDIKAALSDYLVRGISKTNSATLNAVKGPNFTRALNRLEVVAGKFEHALEIEWYSKRQDMKLELIKERVDALLVELNSLLTSLSYSDNDLEMHTSRIINRLKLEVEHIGTSKRSTENEYCYMAEIYEEAINPLMNNDNHVTDRVEECIERVKEWQSKLMS
ncbi:hypothetical protein NQS96_13150 [Pseudoalteromonas shioyasakiensis]|uniref:hypothetical protein n=1 Tax=Pseudoalteromonas shioyasakiensis TaxID=1190813 RepID=UPI00211776C9|nr:hypothetical protein [Pseudoalteromonas shioyasakiensis]MCQ8882721.1 hypothetical protein [Pseudoalteromonas shioyasakiensis]